MMGGMKRAVLMAFVVVVGVGCSDLDTYEGDYSGPVVGAEGESFIRRGFPAGAVLSLEEFDPPPSEGPVGIVTARTGGAADTLLFTAELERIAPLAHDQLGQYDFPGGSRLRNYIFVVRPVEGEGELVGREAFVFVSLMDEEMLEVRVMSGSGDRPGDHFGLFILERQ